MGPALSGAEATLTVMGGCDGGVAVCAASGKARIENVAIAAATIIATLMRGSVMDSISERARKHPGAEAESHR